jgi:phosphatidylglycerol:prolipoprotein diacylglycerol transferase
MHPELFHIGPFAVHSYGVMLALSFILGIYLAVNRGEKRGIKGDHLVNLGFIIIIASVVGARIFYVLFHLDEFEDRLLYSFWPVQEDGTVGLGGLILLGGFSLALLSSALYLYYKKLDFWKMADSVAPSIALGVFLTRIGCFLNGCCFGKACSLPWGVKFPFHSPAGAVMGDIHIHPTQMYSSLYGLIILGILFVMDRKRYFDGFIFAAFLILFGVSRFTVDFFRYYEGQMFIIDGLQVNQIISIILFLIGLSMILYKLRFASRKVNS